MGYLFLSVALFAGATKGYCGKKIGAFTSGFASAAMANTIRMALCLVIGFAIIVLGGDLSVLMIGEKALCISALSGISTAAFVVTWLLAVRKSAYMMLDVFLMLGVLVPILLSGILFNEAIKPTQWVGMGALFAAAALMCSYNNSIKTKINPMSFLLLVLCGVSNGIADFSQKLFVKRVADGSVAAFNFYTYVFAAGILLITFLLSKRGEPTCAKVDVKRIFKYIFIMACCLFANSYFKTLAAERMDAVLLYPLNQGCSLMLSTAMAAILFKEKLKAKAAIGILIAFIGLLFINLF